MLTVDEFIQAFESNNITVECSSGEERAAVIEFLVENGVPHGCSGWSKKLMESTTIELSKWMVVFCGSTGIEFQTMKRLDSIEFSDVSYLLGYQLTVPVDDLL